MIAVSDAWKAEHEKLLVPEGFVEISYLLSPNGLQESAFASGDSAMYAYDELVTDPTREFTPYATNELNLWVLDGSREILPAGRGNIGYVGGNFGTGWVEIALPDTRTDLLAGITITWGENYSEYATDFTITAFNGGNRVGQKRVTDNTSVTSVVELNWRNYELLVIDINAWSLPQRRPKIATVQLGYLVTFGKKDLLNFTHTQKTCLCTGELPKNSISFAMDNSTGRWNPNSPDGVERYLSNRQQMKVRYGYDINGKTEWIKAGTFYLSEWHTPSNGMEARFEARDLLEYMIDEPYTGIRSGTLYEIASDAVAKAKLPFGAVVQIDEVLRNYSTSFTGDKTIAEVLQLCANAACCVMYQDRNGVLHITRAALPASGFTIPKRTQYTWPEFALSKPLANVEVSGGTDSEKQELAASCDNEGNVCLELVGDGSTSEPLTYRLVVDSDGETQTVQNEFISTVEQAAEVAEWIAANLETRQTVSGEWRADPRFDVLDNITLETKLGTVSSVWLNELTYSFNGAFRGTFNGYIPKSGNVVEYYAGEIHSGEVD